MDVELFNYRVQTACRIIAAHGKLTAAEVWKRHGVLDPAPWVFLDAFAYSAFVFGSVSYAYYQAETEGIVQSALHFLALGIDDYNGKKTYFEYSGLSEVFENNFPIATMQVPSQSQKWFPSTKAGERETYMQSQLAKHSSSLTETWARSIKEGNQSLATTAISLLAPQLMCQKSFDFEIFAHGVAWMTDEFGKYYAYEQKKFA